MIEKAASVRRRRFEQPANQTPRWTVRFVCLGSSVAVAHLLLRRHGLGLVGQDAFERAALEDGVAAAAAAGDRILGGPDDLGGAAVGPHGQSLALLVGQREADGPGPWRRA